MTCPYVVVSGQPNGITSSLPSHDLYVLIVGFAPRTLADAWAVPSAAKAIPMAHPVMATRRASERKRTPVMEPPLWAQPDAAHRGIERGEWLPVKSFVRSMGGR